ncbi:inositol polyphosphate 1-phosphatase [Rhinatrema bivittatum]|uniref:inositol polyphosphate 1-phosphatase n=1 Tax=Rhinatrema bivittatum TaxID=194408 RepID=UPI001127A121|nr:inositol polyphosphate 1-phosphatase [Rhinatrema bivittatum]XP_029460768.1 inositol polyphosphate 1-phosphatase [Rhinatrema bivittatum]XP_029460769.1 inositol polyphosphate 1-phosphatase [Rhinatrema bivittatum]
MSEILCELVRVAEKAAEIARACRLEDPLFQLLIEEKKAGAGKKSSYVRDFKTLADVLIQEVIKRDLGKKFPGLVCNIFGEEANQFTNEMGDVITVTVCPTEEETADLLTQVLNGKEVAAEVLARVVHQDIPVTDPVLDAVKLDIPPDSLGIWVDPIDSTHQYIKGCADSVPIHGIYSHGLQCVTVLIGVFELSTGIPVMGVINQPFASHDPKSSRWEGEYCWGISYKGTKFFSSQLSASDEHEEESICYIRRHPDSGEIQYECQDFSVVTGSNESEKLRSVLSDLCGEKLHFSAGAGYMNLCAVLGLVDICLITADNTFKWDSCAPHAILMALGGGVVNWEDCLKRIKKGETKLEMPYLVYNVQDAENHGASKWANKGGLLAFRNKEHLEVFLSLVSEKLDQ